MITTSNSPAKGSGMPNHYAGDLLHTMAISGLSRVRTELFKLTVVPTLTPHPVQMHRQLAGHRYLRDLPSSAHGQVEELAAPLGLTAYRDLRRFHQQKPQQRVALLADVSQASPIAAGFLRRNQAHIAGDLFPASGIVPECRSPTRRPRPSGPRLRDAHQSPCDRPLLNFLLERSRQSWIFGVSWSSKSSRSSASPECPRSESLTTPVRCDQPAATTLSSAGVLR